VSSCCSPERAPADPAGPGVSSAPGPIPPDERAAGRLRRQAVTLPGGEFWMGSEDPDVNAGDAESPVRQTTVAPFAISPTTVTNAQFAAFAKATGYRTTAEHLGWSYVFIGFVNPHATTAIRGSHRSATWWVGVDDADWRHPEGTGSDIDRRPNHPVVHVSLHDARAYCAWVGGRLPHEAEWEYAARGGLDRARFPWGDELVPDGRHRCNVWQGSFPHRNTGDDGWVGTCPVTTYRPNGFGLHNMVGNVWEWSLDRWAPNGPEDLYAMRGGSYLCHESYCNRYRLAARTANTEDSSSGNLGFRVVVNASS